MKILITGGTGYIARNLIKKIKNRHNLGILSREYSNELITNNNTYVGVKIFYYKSYSLVEDVNNCLRIFDPDIVVHASGCIYSFDDAKNFVNLIDSNIYFGSVVLDALSKCKSKKFINLSSYGQHYEIDNDKIGNSFYAATKIAFERILYYFTFRDHMQVVDLSLQHVYGKDENKRIVYKIVKSIKEDMELNLTEGMQVFDFVHIDDVLRAIEHAINELSSIPRKTIYFKSYGVGTKTATNLVNLVEVIKKFLEFSEDVLKWNKTEYRRFEFFDIWDNYIFIPGWIPKVSLEDGIKEVIKSVYES
jgi:CDP-3, 6-dideoxy-D-glycero-L-glycero-4-hexulose-4-reductase